MLKFKKYTYQSHATDAIVNCFKGQGLTSIRKDIFARIEKDQKLFGKSIEDILFTGNRLDIGLEDILRNMQEVQKENEINISSNFFLPNGKAMEFPNFSIEMETGTGKTYVYTKSIFELNKLYGWTKFIIMVPSVAIREGVHSSLELTQQHFFEQYGKKIRFYIYDNKKTNNINNIGEFATSSEIQVMIMNYQAFAAKRKGKELTSKEAKKIYECSEKIDHLFPGVGTRLAPIDIIKKVRPILIIDEPQKFGEVAEEMLMEFNPLFAVRYSATPKKMEIKVSDPNNPKKSKKIKKEIFPKIYRLDAVDAYTEKLVKKISVRGVEVSGVGGASSYIFFDRIEISKDAYPIAYLEIEIKQNIGSVKKTRKIKSGDDLYTISNNMEQYRGYVVSEIDGRKNTISFTNGKTLEVGQISGDISEKHIRRTQIRQTIRAHIEKEREMFDKGIKVLSLFFIDKVDKYRLYDDNNNHKKGEAEYEKIFEEEYKKIVEEEKNLFAVEYNKYLDKFQPNEVHEGYFSKDKKGKMVDSDDVRGEGSIDANAYDLIMKKKEQLLSFKEPVRFIFSHSALREGWDNPNIFQICTLRHTSSDDSRKQEIGRGLRICVDQNGQRMDEEMLGGSFFDYNTLTVIPNESYRDFAKNLQKEVADSLSDRPTIFTTGIINGKLLKNEQGTEFEFDEVSSHKYIKFLEQQGYLDDDLKVTEKFIQAIVNDTIEVPDFLSEHKQEAISLVKRVYDADNYNPVENQADKKTFPGDPNENISHQKFKDLWNIIKQKTMYTLSFDSNELIENSIKAIDEKLKVTNIIVTITKGEQKKQIDKKSIGIGESFITTDISTEKQVLTDWTTPYDLIGKISSYTKLKRETVGKILTGIRPDTFHQFQINPEEFISYVSKYIIEQKSTTLVQSIEYRTNGQEYDVNLFTLNQIRGSLKKDDIINLKEQRMKVKSIHNFIKVDSEGEGRFAEELESHNEVIVYAKLPSGPNGFQIPTPLGNYSPDWAIAFDDKIDGIKYIYFIAETKGNMDDLQLKAIEKGKGEYAKKHFQSLGFSNITYKIVDSYDEMAKEVDIL